MTTDKPRIGIVGVGRMGLAMLKHLVKHGHPVDGLRSQPEAVRGGAGGGR